VAADFDNDADLDLMEACSGEVSNLPNRLYVNDGSGNFSLVPNAGADAALGFTGAAGQLPFGRSDSVLTADFDLDGRMDVFLTNGHYARPFSYAGQQQLIRNVSDSGNNWVQIDLEGVDSNRDAVGARIFATTIGPDGKTQLREQGSGMHKNAQNFKRIHFGLGQHQQVDLEIRWPNGVIETHAGLAVNRIYHCLEGGACVASFVPPEVPPLCGVPTLDASAEAGLFLWEENCGSAVRSFGVRALQGGTTTVVTYQGRVDSDQPFSGVTPFSLESNDVLEVVNGGLQIQYQMQVRNRYLDGFGFSVANTATACFGVDLPAGTLVRVGPDKVPVAAPFDLTTLGSCAAPLPTVCGAPAAGPATAAGLFLWQTNCGAINPSYTVRAWQGGVTGVVTYQGLVTADQPFSGVTAVSLELGDLLTLSNLDQRIDYTMVVRSPYEDGFNFTAPDAASVCFGVNLPAGTQVRVGADATPVNAPFSLPDLNPCTP
jgi:hypothetical protein